jgi:hypothetical protein
LSRGVKKRIHANRNESVSLVVKVYKIWVGDCHDCCSCVPAFLRSCGILICLFNFVACNKGDVTEMGSSTEAWNGTCKLVRASASSIPIYSGATAASKVIGYVGNGTDTSPIKLYIASNATPSAERIFVKVKGNSSFDGKGVWVDSATVDCIGEPVQASKKVCITVNEGMICDTKENIKARLAKDIEKLKQSLKDNESDIKKWEFLADSARLLCFVGSGLYNTQLLLTLPLSPPLVTGVNSTLALCYLRGCYEGSEAATIMDKKLPTGWITKYCPSNWNK